MRYLLIISFLLLISGCKDDLSTDEENLLSTQENDVITYLEDVENDSADRLESDLGFFYYVYSIENGDGTGNRIGSNSVITFTYEVNLLDGTVLENLNASPSVTARLGASALYPEGLEEVLVSTAPREGETIGFILSSPLAFADFEIDGLLPANSVVEIKVRLTRVEQENNVLERNSQAINQYIVDGRLDDTTRVPVLPVERFSQNGIVKKTLRLGTENVSPVAGNVVSMTYDLFLTDSSRIQSVSVNEQFEFVVGGAISGQGVSVIPGLEFGVRQMIIGERALLIIPSSQAYFESAQAIPTFIKGRLVEEKVIPAYAERIDPYTVLVFDVILRGIN